MASTTSKNGRAHVFEVANRVAVQELNSTTLATIRSDLDSHVSSANTAAHLISNITGLQTALNGKAATSHTHTIANVTGLQTALDGKQDTISGATGSFTYVKSVNFGSSTVTTGTINVSNGIITSIS